MFSLNTNEVLRFSIDYPNNQNFATSRYRKLSILPHLLKGNVIFDAKNPAVRVLSKGNRSDGSAIIIRDICDYHLDGFAKIDGWLDVVRQDQFFVFSSSSLKNLYQEKFPDVFSIDKCFVVDDPYTVDSRLPIITLPKGELVIGWYGNGFNLHLADWKRIKNELVRFAKQISIKITLRLFSDRNFCSDVVEFFRDSDINCEIIDYDSSRLNEFLSSISVALLPVDDVSDYSRGKSHNRVIEAVMAGKPVICYGLEEYRKFSSFVFFTKNISAALDKILESPSLVEKDLARGQDFIRERYSPSVIASAWLTVLEKAGRCCVIRKVDDGRSSCRRLLKLNLGSGGVNLPGYVNIDYVDKREGIQPDINCDIRQLPYEDETVDEILSVHVIEHFYYWEFDKLLREWNRVLRVGGSLVTETPDLIQACREVLSNPSIVTGPGVESQRSMWVFYGDPKHRDPLMCHKWLFSPQSLATLLAAFGFEAFEITASQFKLKEPRDFRLECRKVRNLV